MDTYRLTVEELPRITQKLKFGNEETGADIGVSGEGNGDIKTLMLNSWKYSTTNLSTGIWTKPIGRQQGHNTLPPAKAAYIWLRTA